MLLYLADYLTQIYRGFGVFHYLTLRSILGILTALLISFVVGPMIIRMLAHHQIGQMVRTDGPQSHLSKAGTPTMGGAMILVAIGISTLLWGDLSNRYVWLVLGVTLLFGLVGGVDDYKKLILKNSKGLSARQKFFWQSLIGVAAASYLFYSAVSPIETRFIVPFFKDVSVDLG